MGRAQMVTDESSSVVEYSFSGTRSTGQAANSLIILKCMNETGVQCLGQESNLDSHSGRK